jgi:hypothetical protein
VLPADAGRQPVHGAAARHQLAYLGGEGRRPVNCFYHPQANAVAMCARPGCGKGMCSYCVWEDRCWEHAKLSVALDYKIAHGRVNRLWSFTIAVTIAYFALVIGNWQDVQYSGGSPAVLLVGLPFVPVGAWLFYMGMSWIYEKFRGSGVAVGAGYVPSGRVPFSPTAMNYDPAGGIMRIAIIGFVVILLFMVVVWPIMIIGLVTGIQKYKLDRRVISAYRDGSWLQAFPGNYNPDTGQYAAAPKADPQPEPVI